MKREAMLARMQEPGVWDLVVIGGGATGLGIAVDAASRGFKTLLLEQSDFAKGTSSRSTKLAHGGVRYLKQGNIRLVVEALKERGRLFQNAPHLVSHLPFLIPNYEWWEKPFYSIGLKVYDLLAGRLGIEKSTSLSTKEVIDLLPNIHRQNLRGGVIYYDGQFDDARLAIALAQTAADHGAVLLNYMPVIRLMKQGSLIKGVVVRDAETSEEYEVLAKTVVNATGVFSDGLRKMDDEKTVPMIAPSQGVHLVLNRSFLRSNTAMMIPKTEDGRVLFFIPWLNHVLIGTTDTGVNRIDLEPKPLAQEVEFLLNHSKRYLAKAPEPTDILSVFAGLRPLIQSAKGESTSSLSRDHLLSVAPSGLITVAGGKWTTYRKMAQDAVDRAILIGGLKESRCKTETLPLHGGSQSDITVSLRHEKDPSGLSFDRHPTLHPDLPYSTSTILRAVADEMARTLEDVLARRTRSLFLNVRASMEMAPAVAHIMAIELKKSKDWEREQLCAYEALCQNYQLFSL